jgi:hypothetical protein
MLCINTLFIPQEKKKKIEELSFLFSWKNYKPTL